MVLGWLGDIVSWAWVLFWSQPRFASWGEILAPILGWLWIEFGRGKGVFEFLTDRNEEPSPPTIIPNELDGGLALHPGDKPQGGKLFWYFDGKLMPEEPIDNILVTDRLVSSGSFDDGMHLMAVQFKSASGKTYCTCFPARYENGKLKIHIDSGGTNSRNRRGRLWWGPRYHKRCLFPLIQGVINGEILVVVHPGRIEAFRVSDTDQHRDVVREYLTQ